MQNALTGKRVLVTQASEFMGPAFCKVFAEQGADVIESNDPLAAAGAAEGVVAAAGPIDVLVANLSIGARSSHTFRPWGWSWPGKSLPAASWRRVRTLSSQPTCAATLRTVSSGRCFRCRVAGPPSDGDA